MRQRTLAALLALAVVFGFMLRTRPVAQQAKQQNLVAYVVTGVDIKSATSTTIFTTDEGGRFHPLFVVVELTSASSLTIGGTASVGTNASSYNNIMPAAVTGTTLNKMLPNALSALTDSVAPNTAVKLNISIAATGTSGTLSCTVVGYYQ